jgi:hypothetical protein
MAPKMIGGAKMVMQVVMMPNCPMRALGEPARRASRALTRAGLPQACAQASRRREKPLANK